MATNDNFMALLNERAQKHGWTTSFDLVSSDGPDHCKTFSISAVVNNKAYPAGFGRNKKEAKQNAAMNAFRHIEEEEEPASSETNTCSSDSFPVLTQANYTCWLNEYSQKSRLNFIAIESTKMNLDSNNQFCMYACKYVCGNKEFPEAVNKGKREAKEEAAKLVFVEIQKEKKSEVPEENRNEAQNTSLSSLGSSFGGLNLSSSSITESTTAGTNYIGILNQYCQKTNQTRDFKLVEKIGPPHNPVFVYKVVINKKEYPKGKGKTAKEAKHKAAELAWRVLQEQSVQTSSTSSAPEDESPSQTSTIESEDDAGSSKGPSESHSITFRDSSAHSPNPANKDPVPSPQDVKSKRRIAANFQTSPNVKKQTPAKSSALANPAPISTKKSSFLENFDSVSKIGKGGFGRVFKARNIADQKYYAVKIVKCTSKSHREVGALAELVHTNIVRYHTSWIEETQYRDESMESYSSSNSGSGFGDKFLYIQMELCEGDTLRPWIEKRNFGGEEYPERRKEAGHIMEQVLDAVKYVHSKNLMHRDLKPKNIMIGKEEVVKVGDFGLVTVAETDSDDDLLQRTRTGTRSYMSPEQETQHSYDRKVDIFALGLVYFELLWKFDTTNERQKIWGNVRKKMLPKDFSKQFSFEQKLIEQMLSANPEERPDASDLLTKLVKYQTPVFQLDCNSKKENRTY